eukprot:Clim_evm2s186 gene=Clim_evmTU2s186
MPTKITKQKEADTRATGFENQLKSVSGELDKNSWTLDGKCKKTLCGPKEQSLRVHIVLRHGVRNADGSVLISGAQIITEDIKSLNQLFKEHKLEKFEIKKLKLSRRQMRNRQAASICRAKRLAKADPKPLKEKKLKKVKNHIQKTKSIALEAPRRVSVPSLPPTAAMAMPIQQQQFNVFHSNEVAMLPPPQPIHHHHRQMRMNLGFNDYRRHSLAVLEPLPTFPETTHMESPQLTHRSVCETDLSSAIESWLREAREQSPESTMADSISSGIEQQQQIRFDNADVYVDGRTEQSIVEEMTALDHIPDLLAEHCNIPEETRAAVLNILSPEY